MREEARPMLRSLVLATFLLLTLLWTSNAWAERSSSAALAKSVLQTQAETDLAITSEIAITGGNVITVTTTTDEYNNDGDCSLREAIQAADTDSATDNCPAGNSGDTIDLPPGNYVISRQVELRGTITLQGSITGTSVIDGNGQDRVLYIHQDATAVLSYLDISNGQLPVSNCFDYASNQIPSEGAGVANYGRTTIAHSTIYNNISQTFDECDPYQFPPFTARGAASITKVS